jgi:hypothetical protein
MAEAVSGTGAAQGWDLVEGEGGVGAPAGAEEPGLGRPGAGGIGVAGGEVDLGGPAVEEDRGGEWIEVVGVQDAAGGVVDVVAVVEEVGVGVADLTCVRRTR